MWHKICCCKKQVTLYYAGMNKTQTALDRAIAAAGSQQKLAAQIGVTQQAVSIWQRSGRVPAEAAVKVEAATGIPRADIRPDIFGEQVSA